MTAAVSTSYLQRLLRLELSESDPSAITLEQYHHQMQGITPAEMIEPTDTAAQVLFLLTLDTERRDRLAHAAGAHGWSPPEPQPWDCFVHQAARTADLQP